MILSLCSPGGGCVHALTTFVLGMAFSSGSEQWVPEASRESWTNEHLAPLALSRSSCMRADHCLTKTVSIHRSSSSLLLRLVREYLKFVSNSIYGIRCGPMQLVWLGY